MKKVILDFDKETFKATECKYIVDGEEVFDDCTGSFVVYKSRGNYYGCSVDFDDNDLPEEWEEVKEEVISQINIEFR